MPAIKDGEWELKQALSPAPWEAAQSSSPILARYSILTTRVCRRWRRWLGVIQRDQFLLWMPGCLLGMALPAMFSYEYLRGGVANVDGNAVAAMTADALARRHGPSFLVFDSTLRVSDHGSHAGKPTGSGRAPLDGRAMDCLAEAAQNR